MVTNTQSSNVKSSSSFSSAPNFSPAPTGTGSFSPSVGFSPAPKNVPPPSFGNFVGGGGYSPAPNFSPANYTPYSPATPSGLPEVQQPPKEVTSGSPNAVNSQQVERTTTVIDTKTGQQYQAQVLANNDYNRIVTSQGSFSYSKDSSRFQEASGYGQSKSFSSNQLKEQQGASASNIQNFDAAPIQPFNKNPQLNIGASLQTGGSEYTSFDYLSNKYGPQINQEGKNEVSAAPKRQLTPGENLLGMDLSFSDRPPITFGALQNKNSNIPTMAIVQDVGAGVALGALNIVPDTINFGGSLLNNPVQTIAGIPGGIGESLQSPRGLAYLGTQATITGKAANIGITQGKNVFVAARSARKIPIEEVTTPGVISGTEPLPLVGSVEESLKAFRNARTPEGNIGVSTASPKGLAGTEVGVFGKASAGLEDPGLYVTPKGSTSTYFTGVKNLEGAASEVSLNPLKGIGDVPTITNIDVAGVVRYPRGVINQPGFAGLEQFQRDVLAPRGEAVITKRSEIGLGEIGIQQFPATADFQSPGGLNVKKGQMRTEAGTSELEAVIPVGSQFGYKPVEQTGFLGKTFPGIKKYSGYTSFGGKNIAIREASVIGVGGERAAGTVPLSASDFMKQIKSTTSSLINQRTSPFGYGVSMSRVSQTRSVPRTQSIIVSSSPISVPSSRVSITSKTSGFSGMSLVSGMLYGSGLSGVSGASPFSGMSGISIPRTPSSPVPSKTSRPPDPIIGHPPSYPGRSKGNLLGGIPAISFPRFEQKPRERPMKMFNFGPRGRGSYSPDLVSRVFNIRGKVSKGRTYTGLETRPLPSALGFRRSKNKKRRNKYGADFTF